MDNSTRGSRGLSPAFSVVGGRSRAPVDPRVVTGRTGTAHPRGCRLGGLEPDGLPQNMQAMGIAGGRSWLSLFSSHPPIEQRIAALQGQR